LPSAPGAIWQHKHEVSERIYRSSIRPATALAASARTEADRLACNAWEGLDLAPPQGQDHIYAGKIDHSFDAGSSADICHPSRHLGRAGALGGNRLEGETRRG
jgi:hypothetical protein